jgi:hypothetical protein
MAELPSCAGFAFATARQMLIQGPRFSAYYKAVTIQQQHPGKQRLGLVRGGIIGD